LPADGALRVACQMSEEIELLAGEVDRLAAAQHDAAIEVDHELVEVQHVAPTALEAARRNGDAGDELREELPCLVLQVQMMGQQSRGLGRIDGMGDWRVGLWTGLVTKPLFQIDIKRAPGYPYAVAPDGSRFLVNTPADANNPVPMALVLNWPATLKK